jgi:hypothetical protein
MATMEAFEGKRLYLCCVSFSLARSSNLYAWMRLLAAMASLNVRLPASIQLTTLTHSSSEFELFELKHD